MDRLRPIRLTDQSVAKGASPGPGAPCAMPSKATKLSSVVLTTTGCTLTGLISWRTTARRSYSVPARIPGTSILINRYSSGPSPAGPANRAGPLLRAARLTSALYSPNGVEDQFSEVRALSGPQKSATIRGCGPQPGAPRRRERWTRHPMGRDPGGAQNHGMRRDSP
jgi:hypothetical protein